MYTRLCNILKTRSFFLFGARGTGKSSLLRQEFEEQSGLWVDLLRDRDFVTYQKNPGLIYDQSLTLAKEHQRLSDSPQLPPKWIVVDEVQRVPKLLNEIHRVLESTEAHGRVCFALTGSSARKLKRGGANLLGGRALVNNLYPLTSVELGEQFNLDFALNWGTLPYVTTEPDPLTREELLDSYYATYLREEIKEEQIVRQLDPFTRFLEIAAQMSGQILNYAAIARDCRVGEKAVARYYQILEDTLLGITIPSFDRSVRQQQSKSPRFYFFDLGVQRALSGTLNSIISPQCYGFGRAFEQFVVLEIYRLNSYLRKRFKLFYLRTKDNLEIDLIVEVEKNKFVLIEVKSSTTAELSHAKHVKKFKQDIPNSEAWVVSLDEQSRVEDDVCFLHWKEALLRLYPELKQINDNGVQA
jgi:predicted AAA+ superfamily ATPase